MKINFNANYIKRFVAGLIMAFGSMSGLEAKSLVRRALGKLAPSNSVKVLKKPINWIAQTKLYKKYPWLVKGIGIIGAGLAAKRLYTKAQTIRSNYKNRFFTAARNGDIKRIRQYLKQGGEVNATRKEDSTTLLMEAAKSGNVLLVRELIANGANIDVQDYRGQTALMDTIDCLFFESGQNYLDVVRELIDAHADVNIVNDHGYTALQLAMFNEKTLSDMRDQPRLFPEIINVSSFLQFSQQLLVQEQALFDVVKILIEAGADVSKKGFPKEKFKKYSIPSTALDDAICNKMAHVVKELMIAGAELSEDNIKWLDDFAQSSEQDKVIFSKAVKEIQQHIKDTVKLNLHQVTSLPPTLCGLIDKYATRG